MQPDSTLRLAALALTVLFVASCSPAARTTEAPREAASSVAERAVRGPVIYAVDAQPLVAHAGDRVVWEVRTSPEVARVTASVPAFSMTLARHGAGRFGASFVIPKDVPGMFFGDYPVEFIAYDPRGSSVRRTVKIRFQ